MSRSREHPAARCGARSGGRRGYIAAGAVVAAVILVLLRFPARMDAAGATAWSYVIQMATILPPVMVLVGLFDVFLAEDKVAKYVGKASGIRGIIISVAAGALPSGPLYVAFPLVAALLKKGASVCNAIIMLSAWACIKLPQELLELHFLGARFMLTRLALTIACVVPMGLVVGWLVEWGDGRGIPSAR